MNIKFHNSTKTILSILTVAIALYGFTYSFPKVTFNENADRLSNYKQKKYKKDATRLALRMISKDGNYSAIAPQLPEDMVESIYNALVAVHLSDLAKAKEVTKAHKLHTFPVPNVDRFFVMYRRDAPWATPLRLGDNETDNEQINSLCQQFGLVIENNVEWDEDHNSFHIRAKQSLNIAPIAQEFLTIQGIAKVDLLTPNGDGNDIEIKKIADGWELNYQVKFDGCISGCQKKHNWSFAINAAGEVKFIGESGDELPEWMKNDD